MQIDGSIECRTGKRKRESLDVDARNNGQYRYNDKG